MLTRKSGRSGRGGPHGRGGLCTSRRGDTITSDYSALPSDESVNLLPLDLDGNRQTSTKGVSRQWGGTDARQSCCMDFSRDLKVGTVGLRHPQPRSRNKVGIVYTLQSERH